MTRDRNKLVDGSLNIYDIYDDRVVLTSNLSNATGQSVYSFQSFNKIYETKYAFYLSLSKYQALIIDKSAMTEEGIVRFRDIIGRNVLKGKYKLKLKSSILPLIISAVVIISFLAFNTVYGFMYFTNNVSDEYKVKTFVIPSTEFCISVPSSWTELDLNDAASFQMGNPRKEQYMIIISEPVADFGYDFELEDYADALGEYMSGNIDSAMKSQAAETVIGTNIKAIQFEIEGSIQGIDAKYLVTCAQIGDSYYQFTAWSLQSEYENVVPVFNDILGSIGENI
ncbi:MAG: YcxB family protein [Oscillospiraceae bacterium]|nr:YcxB family protein [Oscillospiraceae bacterium]